MDKNSKDFVRISAQKDRLLPPKRGGMNAFGICVIVGMVACTLGCAKRNDASLQDLTPTDGEETWMFPVKGEPSPPMWGHKNGIRIGIAPLPGPRGLLRVYAPYLGHSPDKMLNFIAFEPVVTGSDERGFSELEMSQLDGVRGKRFWSSNDSLSQSPSSEPATGIVSEIMGEEALTVFIHCEPFDRGAKVYTRLRFFAHRPYEVELTAYQQQDSAPLHYFILTATMGNYARLRHLYLMDTIKSSLTTWPDYRDIHFTEHEIISADKMIYDTNGYAYFIAAPDEEDPAGVDYANGTKEHWKYYGQVATQYWKKPNPSPNLQGLVNGRFTYWASESPIPGGISYENFELKTPFINGSTYIFGATPLTPQQFIKSLQQHDE